jgi:hypothetical protein
MILAAILAAATLGAPALARAQTPAPADDPAALSVYLLTMGQGDLVWEKFGHNAIWIHDPRDGTDRVYNYGVFDFASPGYWSRFIEGAWIYQLAVNDIHETLAHYRYFDRTIVAQELNLTPREKAELRAFLETNARPENREYLYDYYRDNCSTRVRDVIDMATGGALSASMAGVPTGTTYRWHSLRLIAADRLAYTGLVAGLGAAADRPITAWEEMFLPEKLNERVREVTVDRPDGAEPLVLSEQVLYAASREPEREEPPAWLVWYLLIGSAIGATFVGLGAAAAGGGAAARFGFAALASVWTLLVGTGGLILVGLWAFTDHTIAHANENLLHISPLALPLALLAAALPYGVRWAAEPARVLALAVAGISALGLIMQFLPGLDQVNGEVIALMLPAHAGLAVAIDRLVKR